MLPTSAFLLAAALALPLSGAPAVAPPDFAREVRPILSENCFKCHGMDQHKHGLRLDERAPALKGGKSDLPAIVPGDPDDSELFARITSGDENDVMPPPDTHKTLRPDQIEILRRWIKAGAEYKPHWAYVAPVRPKVPAAAPASWPRNPIDRFVLARLDQEHLAPASAADPVTLCRRLYLDLVGLPPAPAEADAFAAAYAHSPDAAVDALVEQLLASPHYGEKWARSWLDAARYADSNGYEKDRERIVWPYRDYVIGAFNRDLPYDRFIIEQVAGDELPHATPDQVAATGFLRLSMLNEEGAIDPEEFRMAAMYDRVDVLGKSVLGLTVACAQCHNHKYDPITQEDYYRLFAFLNNDFDAMPAFYTAGQRRAVAELTAEIVAVEDQMKAKLPGWEDRLAQWEKDRLADEPRWQPLDLENVGDHGERYDRLPDGSYLAGGWAPLAFTAFFKSKPTLARITAFRIEALTHPDLPAGGPGRSVKGNFALSEFEVRTWADPLAGLAEPKPEELRQHSPEKCGPPPFKFSSALSDADTPPADLDLTGERSLRGPGRIVGAADFAADRDERTAWTSDLGPGQRNADRAAVFRLATPIDRAPGAPVYLSLLQEHGGKEDSQDLGRFRILVTDSEKLPTAILANDVLEALAIPRALRTAGQEETIFRAWSATVPEFKDENKKLAALWGRWPEYTTTYALQPRDALQSRVTHILERGNWLKPLKAVTPGTPHFLFPLPAGADGSRLTLARWLVDPRSPLTARVFVNRVWQAYFGIGLVATSEDFGLQSPPPSHPELLDWLACEFMHPSEPGVAPWSIKHLQRLIATSATYRQSSRITPEAYARDPDNRLLARGPRFRVDGEIIRDIALASSGLLNARIGGRSVMPPAPPDLFLPPASYTSFPWIDETGPEKYRRALYTFRRRSSPYPMLQAFDTPNGDISCVRRLRSDTPIQALTLLNEPVFMDCAVALARRTLEEAAPTDEARVSLAFRRTVTRAPDSQEEAVLLSLLHKQQQRYAQGQLDPAALVSSDIPPPLGTTTSDWAALTVVSRAILNLDETITKE